MAVSLYGPMTPAFIWKERGNVAYKSGMIRDALEHYTEAIRADAGVAPSDLTVACWMNRSRMWHLLDHSFLALTDVLSLEHITGQRVSSWRHVKVLVSYLVQLEQYKTALARLRDAKSHITDDNERRALADIDRDVRERYATQLKQHTTTTTIDRYTLCTERMFTCASPDVTTNTDIVIRASEIAGRGAFAQRDFAVDDVVLDEQPVVVGMVDDVLRCEQCTVEIDSCETDIRCRICKSVAFCSFDCLTQSRHHASWQCDIDVQHGIKGLRADGMVVLVMIAHLLAPMSRTQHVLTRLPSSLSSARLPDDMQLFCDEGWQQYRRVCYTLGLHPAWFDYYTFDVLRILIVDHAIMVTNKRDEEIGGALFSLINFFNHSCEPTIHYTIDSRGRMIMRATRPIRKGDEMFFCYIPDGSLHQRQAQLMTYGFVCRCERCKREANDIVSKK